MLHSQVHASASQIWSIEVLYCVCVLLYNQGGKILLGGSVIKSDGNFVQPTIVEISPSAAVVKEELFGPVLYVMKFQVSLCGLILTSWYCDFSVSSWIKN